MSYAVVLFVLGSMEIRLADEPAGDTNGFEIQSVDGWLVAFLSRSLVPARCSHRSDPYSRRTSRNYYRTNGSEMLVCVSLHSNAR